MDTFDLNKRHCYYFNEICRIPHGSCNEKEISDFVCAFAEKNGLKYSRDEVFNVIIDKPASPGYENSEPVILQAHMDMVCEKNADTEHNFETDPLDLYVEDGWLKARGTTLGADDGTGVAYMLAILEDRDLKHPPLECIFTVQEEIGLCGAMELKPEDLHGNRFISLDGDGESVTETSCAGSFTGWLRRDIHWEDCSLPEYRLTVKGLLGGHSGGMIHLERGNAIQIAGRILKEARLAGIDLSLTSVSGGLKRNAIPREAVFTFVSDTPYEKLSEVLNASIEAIRAELLYSDGGLNVLHEKTGTAKRCFSKEDTDAVLNYIYLMPQGYLHHSMAVEDLTTASLNLGVTFIEDDKAVLEVMGRAADDSMLADIANHLTTLAGLLGFAHEIPDPYPGWAYSAESELREIMKDVVERRGLTFSTRATHGGLECGIVKGLNPKLDIITFGPIHFDIHSPSERLNLQSFDDSYAILCEILENCR